MSLQALLADVDQDWHAAPGGEAIADAVLLARAQASVLGRRLLARQLAAGPGAALLAPGPGRDVGTVARRWPRATLSALARDLGVLAFAPAIRAEIRREPVRRMKAALGGSYLLALDQGVWDGRAPAEVQLALQARLSQALLPATAPGEALLAMFDAQGRAELGSWARQRDPALADWVALLHPRQAPVHAHLPEKPVLRLVTHHELRGAVA